MSAKIKLQVALDVGDAPALLALARRVAADVDWLEAGTPWILADGMAAVRRLRQAFPDKFIVADMKIMDGGTIEAEMGFAAGANLVTVLGLASDATLKGALQAARAHGGFIMADLIQAPDVLSRARELTALGVHYLGVHTAHDDQASGRNPLADLAALSGLAAQGAVRPAPVVAAGGINLRNIGLIAAYHPAAVVVGSALTGAADPQAAAKELQRELERVENGLTGLV